MSGDATFTVEVLTPEGEVFRGDVISISTKASGTASGQHTVVLAGRAGPRRALSTAETVGTSAASGT